ncbi:MAG: hypothetical protein PUE12_12940 [Oscillospiraceae bacterium]|nr:hypothetical protein [Oscillospiraceae bacterium]
MAEDTTNEVREYVASMTKEQAEAYNSFIDYMVELYCKYGHLFGEDANSGESVG